MKPIILTVVEDNEDFYWQTKQEGERMTPITIGDIIINYGDESEMDDDKWCTVYHHTYGFVDILRSSLNRMKANY